MILVDTSVWIELLRKKPSVSVKPDDFFLFMTCPPVIQEVLQGVKMGLHFRRFESDFLAFPLIGDPISKSTYIHAAHIYRLARTAGITIRSSIDCLIAAIAIENTIPIWHNDRDFDQIQKITDLQIYKFVQ